MLAALYLLAIAMAGLWLVLPWHLPIVLAGLLAIGLAHSYQRGRSASAFPRADIGVGRNRGWVRRRMGPARPHAEGKRSSSPWRRGRRWPDDRSGGQLG